MTAATGIPSAMTKLRTTVEIGVVAVGTLVAVGVSVLFIAVTGTGRTSSAPRRQSPAYVPLIQNRRAVAQTTAAGIKTTPTHQRTQATATAKQSDGAVP